MCDFHPIQKNNYQSIISKIQSNSAVGIDAPLTHAIIIDYLDQILSKLKNLETRIEHLERT